MRLLLDTHIWLWSLLEPERLAPRIRSALESPDSELWLSPVSVWEALLLAERGRIQVDAAPRDWVARMVQATPRREAVLTHEIALASRTISLPHQDPADRFLVATAQILQLTLVTADERLIGASAVDVLANR